MLKYDEVYFMGDNQAIYESGSVLPKQGIEAYFPACLQP